LKPTEKNIKYRKKITKILAVNKNLQENYKNINNQKKGK